MAKNRLSKVLSLLFVFLLCVGCLFACKPDNDDPIEEVKVNVTVDGGSGSGAYKEGERCTVTAEQREGYRFVEWQVYGVSVSKDETYVFEVDFDIELKAVYEALPYTSYTVTVDGGRVGQDGPSVMKVKEGETVMIYPAESQARKFVKWVVDGAESTANPYELTVTKDTEIYAIFEDYCMISVNGGTVNGQRNKIVKMGEEVTVKANADDSKTFVYWYTMDENYQETVLSKDFKYTFVLNDSMKIYAKFLNYFTVTVINGTASDDMVLDGETVTLVADESPDPTKAFIGWYIKDKRVSLEKEYEYEVISNSPIEAKYGDIVETIKLPTPDSSSNTGYPTTGILYKESGGSIALDRLGDDADSSFAPEALYVRYDIYASADADKSQPLGSFKIRVPQGMPTTNAIGWVETMDGSISEKIIRGGLKNYYIYSPDVATFINIIKEILGYDYYSGQSYYFAATSVADYDVIDAETNTVTRYVSSDRSEITTSAIVASSGAPITKYTISVVNGTIDGDKTSVVAGHGASVTVKADDPIDNGTEYIFGGWYEVTYDSFGTETVGANVSKNTKYTFSASKNVTIKAIYIDKADLPQLETPNTSDNKLIYSESSGPWAFDRSASGSMFSEDVDYVIYYLYGSSDADKDEYLGAFMIKVDVNKDADGGNAIVGYLSLLDGTHKKEVVRGNLNNYYSVDAAACVEVMQAALGANYDSSQSYYYACQAITASEAYINSEISAISTAAIKF